jgi:hypothetical protein
MSTESTEFAWPARPHPTIISQINSPSQSTTFNVKKLIQVPAKYTLLLLNTVHPWHAKHAESTELCPKIKLYDCDYVSHGIKLYFYYYWS